MKLTIAGYEVEIKAKYNTNDRYNKIATEDFLNTLSLYLGRVNGSDHYTKEAHDMSDDIFDELNKRGVYDSIRK